MKTCWIYVIGGVECAAIGCGVRLHPKRLMCQFHLRLIPPETRLAIVNSKPGVERQDLEQDAIEQVGEVAHA